MVEAQAFDGVPDRPFHELGAERAAALEIERARARQLDGAADPERMIGGAEQGLAAIGAVDQHAEAGAAVRHLRRGLDGEHLEVGNALDRRADLLRHRLELHAVVDGERHERVGLSGRRVVAQWMWLMSSSKRRALWRLPAFRKCCSSGKVGISGEQSRRETANAPLALA